MQFTYNPLAALFVQPDAQDILKKQLLNAESSLAEHSANREYHAAMEKMLAQRIVRIRKELGKTEA
jgi:hypothetical protein